MRRHMGEFAALVVLAPLACASTIEERRDYILAHPHGWVEVSVEDQAVPQVPSSEDRPSDLVRPESCSIEVHLDRESFVYGHAYPTGDSPPYSVKTGFRFAAPVGALQLLITYSGCDFEAGKASSASAGLSIAVEEDRVTEVHFDGVQPAAEPSRENSVVTLDDIYEAVTGQTKSGP